jgi:hypothetical protein
MQVRFLIGGATTLTATLDDTAPARDFAALLPLSLTLDDYAATEKISDLPRRLDTTGTPDGYKASAGDITYYAPWGNLAIFLKDFRHASGLVRLGQFDLGIDCLKTSGPIRVTVQRVER